MSNLEADPGEAVCEASPGPGPRADLYPARTVPLGGVRGLVAERLLPQRDLPTVGAWCFLDHFGSPGREPGTPWRIGPHPHIGLQTVTWPFAGRIRHRDTIGSDVAIEPGELNLMTAGHGCAHSEDPVAGTSAGHALQLWIALPDSHRHVPAHFEQHRGLPVLESPGLRATVLAGSLGGVTSPAITYTPLVGADLRFEPAASAGLPLRAGFEHAILLISGELTVAGAALRPGPLLYLGSGREALALASPHGAHAILLGGEPFTEDLVMWWNFVARGHDEINDARNAWERHDLTWFPDIPGQPPDYRIPAPQLPAVRLRPRHRRAFGTSGSP